MQSGACHCHIQLAVNHHSVLHEHVVGEEVQLIVLLHSESVDNIVALTALISLYRVDGDVVQYGNARLVNGAAYSSNLVTVGHNDSYSLILVKPFLGLPVNLDYRCSNHFRFHLIGLHRSRSSWAWCWHKRHTSHTQQLCYSVGGCCRTVWQRLMLQRHHFKAVAVEGIVGKLGYCLVHTSLAGEHVDIARVVALIGLELCQQPFE